MENEFGRLIRKERIKRGLSVRQLAEESGILERSIYHWEAGTRGITLENADRILKTLGISITIGADTNYHFD